MKDWFEFRESFDKKYRFTMKTDKDGDYSADTVTDDGSKLRMIMYKRPNTEGEWHVGFARNMKSTVTGEGDALKIMATVLDFVKKVAKKENPEVISFEAEGGSQNKKDVTGSRASLYTRVANKYASQMGYRVTQSNFKGAFGQGTEFKLVRK
jgi:hypothetical protein